MNKLLAFNAFDMNCVGHIQQGLWRHPRDQSTRYCELDYWLDHARRLEAGFFDGIFFADVLGVYDVYQGSPDAALRHAVQVPVNDPLMLIPAMASVTRHLGFGVTANLSYESPYSFARRLSTLDHLTGGRIGWNIVTGYLDSAARAMGFEAQRAHDDRYDLADEFMAVVYALWEGSWADDAVLADRIGGQYADPQRIRRVRHQGPQYRIDAMHLSEPSPQRTPVLFQAGASDRGKRFAAQHAECVFLNGQSEAAVRELVLDLRKQAMAYGRAADSLRIFLGATIVTGATEAEAKDRFEDYRQYVSSEAALVHAAASLGIDLSRFDLDEPVDGSNSQAIRSNVDAVARQQGARPSGWTVRRLLEQMVLGSRQTPLVGSGAQIAEALIRWRDVCGVDGFNLSRTVVPECFDDFIAHVVPQLQSRGACRTSHEAGTLRRKLFGQDRLPPEHPGAARARQGLVAAQRHC